jgi:hypothetical protein
MIWSKLKQLGWQRLNVKRVGRSWHRKGLKALKNRKSIKSVGLATVPIRLIVGKPKVSTMFGAGILSSIALSASVRLSGL